MDLNALMQAAMQDPAARDFIGKIAGGAPRSGPAPAPAFTGAKQAVDEMLRGFDPVAMSSPPQAAPQPPQGAPMPPPGMEMPQQGGMAPPAPAPGPGGMGMPPDLMSMLMGGR